MDPNRRRAEMARTETIEHYEDRPLKELLRELSDDSARLVRQESELFRREMDARVDRIQREVTMLGAGGVVAYVGVLALSAALILLLALAMPLWVAALLVGAAYVIAGGALVATGKKKLQEEDLAPRQTIQSVRRDVHAVREAMR
jgi:hypothetical protein